MDRDNKSGTESKEEMKAMKTELVQIFESLPPEAREILLIAARMASIQHTAA